MMKTFVAMLLVLLASVLVATGNDGGGLGAFAPFGKEG